MDSLEKYLFKRVTVIDTDNNVHDGYVDVFTSAADNDDTEESIGIMPDENAQSGIELFSSEIKEITLK